MSNFKKSLLSLALTACLAIASTPTMAYNTFSIDQSNSNNSSNATIADRLTGNYFETITFGNGINGIAIGSFKSSVAWDLGQIINDTTNTNTPAGWNHPTGNGEQLYALSLFSGTFITIGPTTVFTIGSSTQASFFNLYYSTSTALASFSNTTNGGSFYTTNLGGILIGSGSNIIGSGTETCTSASQPGCGHFSISSTFLPINNNYFMLPSPFYNTEYNGGQFNAAIPVAGATLTTNGSLDVTFGNIPEPASLALVGFGLLGLGFVRRKQH